MEFISEKIIDQVVESLESDSQVEFYQITEDQHFLLQFIASENFKLLNEEEYNLLTFLISVILLSVKSQGEVPILEGERIESNDEKNWQVITDLGNKNFAKVLDHFFENYKQEDLLALVEDTLSGEDTSLTTVGKELLFVTCKTIIDTLQESSL